MAGMSRFLSVLLALTLLIAGCSQQLTDTVAHTMTVRDSEDLHPIQGAHVKVSVGDETRIEYRTNQDGVVTILLSKDDEDKVICLSVSANGYEDYELKVRESWPDPILLDRISPITTPAQPTSTPQPTPTRGIIPTSKPDIHTPYYTQPPSPTPTQMFIVEPSSTPEPTKTTRPTEPLTAPSIRDLWPTNTGCSAGGVWWADLWVYPTGGDGSYTYYVEGNWRVGPTGPGVTIHFDRDTCTAIVGKLTVESAGMFASREFFIRVPECCH